MATLTKRFYKIFFFRLYKTRMATLLFGFDVFCKEKIKQPILSVLNLNMKLAAKKPNDEAGK